MIPAGGQSPGRRTELGILLLTLLAAGIVLWSVLLPRAEKSVFGRVPILDEIYYLDRAAELPEGALCPREPCFMSPLYPQLIRLVGSDGEVPAQRVMAPSSLRAIRLGQIVCWLGTLVLLGWIGWRDLGSTAEGRTRRLLIAATPAVLFFLYRPAAAYTTSILVEMPLTFLVTAVLALLPGPQTDRSLPLWRALAAGLALGLAGLLRGTALALIPLALWLAWPRKRIAGQKQWLAPLMVIGATALVWAVPVIHNSRLAGRPSPPTINGGVNLFIGNGPQANGFYVAAIPGDWRDDPAGRQFLADQMGERGISLVQADSLWTARALKTMAQDPGRVFLLWAKKIWLHLQGWEIDQLLPLRAWSAAVPPARLLGVPYGLLVVLGLGYGLLMLARRNRSPAAGWMLGLLLLMALQSVFFVVSRYRLVLVPFWALLAGAFLAARLPWKIRGLLILAGLIAVIPWGLGDVRAMWSAMAEANEARRWAQVGTMEESPSAWQHAHDLYHQALAGGAPGPVSWLGLISVDSALGDREAYQRDLDQALQAFPNNLALLKQRVSDLLQSHREDLALPLLRRILTDNPHDADTLHNTAVLLAGEGDKDGARLLATRLVEFHPEDIRGYVDLGIIQARLGLRDQARATFAKGLAQHPENQVLQKNLQLLGSR